MKAEFPILYHAHHLGHTEDLDFWLELAHSTAGPILELGCGTGRVLLALAKTGRHVYGLDNDPNMLAVLRQQVGPEIKETVTIWQGDLTAFRVGLRFSLVLLPCNTYSTLTKDQRSSALACVREHLAEGGIFAASLPNPSLFARLPAVSAPEVEEIFPHPVDGEPVQVSSSWRRSKTHFSVTWDYDHLLPDGNVDRTSVLIEHQRTPARTYLQELQDAGLGQVETFGDYNRSPYTPGSPLLIFTAKNGN